MKETSAIDRFAALSIRTGLSLGLLHSSRVADFNLMLAAAALAFAPDRSYYRDGGQRHLCAAGWRSEGSILAVDHVELRRWLVDCRVLSRDDYGRAYGLAAPAPQIAALVTALSGIDLAAIAAAARARHADAREERKQRWADGRREAGTGARS